MVQITNLRLSDQLLLGTVWCLHAWSTWLTKHDHVVPQSMASHILRFVPISHSVFVTAAD